MLVLDPQRRLAEAGSGGKSDSLRFKKKKSKLQIPCTPRKRLPHPRFSVPAAPQGQDEPPPERTSAQGLGFGV